jgi:hypothetical protein
MEKGVQKRLLAVLAIAVIAAAALPGCGAGSGGGTEAETADAATRVLRCIESRGGEEWPLSPILPDDAPSDLQTVYAIGPERGHIGVIMSLQPAEGRRLAKELEEIAEYRAIPINGGRDVLIYDPGLRVPDKATIYDCTADLG